MKKIGIIGGIGPESTIAYYRLLIEQYRKQLSTKHYPEFLIHSIDMTEMLGYVFDNQLDDLVTFLRQKIHVLEQAQVDCVALASNTPHIVFDQLEASSSIEMISIVKETCKSVAQRGFQKVGLLGTQSTMSKGFYQQEGLKQGIEIIIPNKEEQYYVHEKYMGELVFNRILSETKKQLIHIVNDMENTHQIEGIILGGTELPLILQQKNFESLEVFNTTAIHVDAILDRMITH